MLFHSYSYLREINKEELIYDLSGKKEDFIYLERQEIQAEYHYSYPRIQKGISATEKEGNLEEEVLQLNIELELYYK